MMDVLHYPADQGAPAKRLLVMLPGAGIEAGDFAARGMVAVLREFAPAIDIVAARPAMELYLEGGVPAALHEAVIAPALARGYRWIGLLGISLGGMGALSYAATYPGPIDCVILLAPFLGTQGTVAEISRQGGLAAWSPERSAAVDMERRMLVWLRDFVRQRSATPKIYLGYGQADRFAPGHRLLAAHLPDDRVATEPGGHDWETWLKLCRRLLERSPFTATTVARADG